MKMFLLTMAVYHCAIALNERTSKIALIDLGVLAIVAPGPKASKSKGRSIW